MKSNKKNFYLVSLIFLFLFLSLLSFSSETVKPVKFMEEKSLLKPTPAFIGWINNKEILIREKGELIKLNIKSFKKTALFSKKDKEFLSLKGIKQNSFIAHKNYNLFLFKTKNSLYLFNKPLYKIYKLPEILFKGKNLTFSPDGNRIGFTVENNLYSYDILAGKVVKITNDSDKTILNGFASWVYYEEILGRSSRYKAFYWSRDSQKIAFLKFYEKDVPKFPIFIPDPVNGKIEWQTYPKAGQKNPKVELWIYNFKTKKLLKVNYPDEDKDHYIAFPFWDKTSKILYFQYMNRDQNNTTIYSYSLTNKKTEKIYSEFQKEWVEFFDKSKFYIEEDKIFIVSTIDGWRNLYEINVKTKKVKKLTSGNWLITSIKGYNRKRKTLYFTARNPVSTEQNLFSINIKRKTIKRITKMEGWNRVYISPSYKYTINIYSNIKTPQKAFLTTIKGNLKKLLWDSFLKVSKEYAVSIPELRWVKVREELKLPAVFLFPYNFRPDKKYPVLLYVYGGPSASIVRNSFYGYRWSYLTQKGIIVVLVDHRGSGHFGKMGEILMHRNLGKVEMEDYIDFLKALKKYKYISTNKLCIMGGSYGGYITLYALSYGAEYFRCGVSNFPVTDWHLYDSVYTERYMDKPSDNPDGYKKSSVFTHLKNFNGKLLITHGSADDNVHFQNTLKLISSLEDYGKPFSLMVYTNERHGIGRKKYRHYLKTIYNFIIKNLL